VGTLEHKFHTHTDHTQQDLVSPFCKVRGFDRVNTAHKPNAYTQFDIPFETILLRIIDLQYLSRIWGVPFVCDHV